MTFKGKAIYNPSGKAGEYSYWACNFYVGCSNGCTYCYLKKGRGASVLGGDTPTLKKCFRNEGHAIEIFKRELKRNIDSLRKHGIFLSFTTDPMLKETILTTMDVMTICFANRVPVKILTKTTSWFKNLDNWAKDRSLVAIGTTLTGHDELEPGASTNIERLEMLELAKELGYKTFASVEPIIDFESSLRMIDESSQFCDLYKVGLQSGKKYGYAAATIFMDALSQFTKPKFYIKESLRKLVDYRGGPNFVDRDFNLFRSDVQ